MADTALSALTATTALASGDLFYVVDGGASRKIDYDDVVAQIAAATKTLTNTTFDANGTGNTLSNVETADIASGSKSGADATLVTGTAGTSGNLASWNVDGDLVDSGSAPSAFATAAQGALADSATQPGDDASTLGSGAATDGYVLTADGLGGAAWEAASGGGGTPGGSDTQVQFNDGGAFGGDSGMTFDKTAKTMTLGGGTLTASSPVLDMAQTWNNVATTFTGIKYNVTDTNSASGSLLMDLQVGGSSKFSVAKSGQALTTYAGTGSSPAVGIAGRGGFYSPGANQIGLVAGTTPILQALSGVFRISSSSTFEFGVIGGGSGTNVILAYDAANTLAQRNSTNPQAFRVYNTYDGTNNEWGAMWWDSNTLYIGSEKSGTGASRQVVLRYGGGAVATFGGDTRFNSAVKPSNDNGLDLGESTTTRRWRNVYIGTSAYTPRLDFYSGTTVAGLPTPALGMMARVTDATAPSVGLTVTGGGAAAALVWYNGTNWTVIGV